MESKFQKDAPGIWFSIHISSINLEQNEFSNFLEMILHHLSCLKCREHALEYLSTHPLDEYKKLRNFEGEKIGMFKWTWEFHNSVNLRLGKHNLDFETAYNMYKSEDQLCSSVCSLN